jgi:hypothetical protein
MKKITIALFAVIALASCGGESVKNESENCADTCKAVTATTVAATTDSVKVAAVPATTQAASQQ